jgi:hypothetical protein
LLKSKLTKNKKAQPLSHAFLNRLNFPPLVLRRELNVQSGPSNRLQSLNKIDPTAKQRNYLQTQTSFLDALQSA